MWDKFGISSMQDGHIGRKGDLMASSACTSMHVRHSYRLSFPFFLKQSRMKFLSLLRDRNATPVTNASLACN
jgi:hypothetical protein